MIARAIGVWLALALGCGSPPQTTETRSHTRGPLAQGVVARVGDTLIRVEDVERLAASSHLAPDVALRRLEDEALLAQAARADFSRDPAARRTLRQASVQALLEREIEARVDRVDESELERAYEASPQRFDEPERRGGASLVVSSAGPEAQAWVGALVDRLAGSADPVRELEAAREGPGPARQFGEVPLLARDASRADAAYLEAIFTPIAPGLVERPVLTGAGWAALVVTQIEPGRTVGRADAIERLRAERLAELRAAELERLLTRLRAERSIEVNETALSAFARGEP